VSKPAPLRSRLCNAMNLLSRAREQAVISDFRHRLLDFREISEIFDHFGTLARDKACFFTSPTVASALPVKGHADR
jgi:hypothetical protein